MGSAAVPTGIEHNNGACGLFDTSVDVLLGYKLKDNRLPDNGGTIEKYQSDKDEAGLAEAEKALKNIRIPLKLCLMPQGFSVCSERSAAKKGLCGAHWSFGKKQAAYCAEYEPADKRKHTVRKHSGGAAHNGRSRTRR